MSDYRRLSIISCFLLVVLRMSIGWQLLYEGLWKIESLKTANPWTAEGYLKNAQGPFRDKFRELTGDPNDLNWLDADKVASRWDDWRNRFVSHYGLSDEQTRRLDLLLDGPADIRAVLATLPEGVEFRGSLGGVIRFDAANQRLIVDGEKRMLPAERDRLLAMATLIEAPEGEELSDADKATNAVVQAYHDAVNRVFTLASRLSYKQRMLASLKGDPSRAGTIDEEQEGTIDYKRLGSIDLYKQQLDRYEQNLQKADEAFQFEHLTKLGLPGSGDLNAMRSSVVGPIRGLEGSLKEEARKLLTVEQLGRGPVPEPMTPIRQIDQRTIWSLTIIGMLLIMGLFSRLSALAGAGLITLFYLAIPPWPGVPQPPSPEHSYIVNKNLIEVIALLGLATMPTGRWLGLDALIRRFVFRRNTD